MSAEASPAVREILQAHDPNARRTPPWVLLAWMLGAARVWKRDAGKVLTRRDSVSAGRHELHFMHPARRLDWLVWEGHHHQAEAVWSLLVFGEPGNAVDYHRVKRRRRWVEVFEGRYGRGAVQRRDRYGHWEPCELPDEHAAVPL